jgi:hypothetical protein
MYRKGEEVQEDPRMLVRLLFKKQAISLTERKKKKKKKKKGLALSYPRKFKILSTWKSVRIPAGKLIILTESCLEVPQLPQTYPGGVSTSNYATVASFRIRSNLLITVQLLNAV